ncbi:MAG: type II secretion system F family protein [Candidatus ainarchaeum sp.]|nr:type II secretion system F family protein [Candidatus ainarchaeum sp.]
MQKIVLPFNIIPMPLLRKLSAPLMPMAWRFRGIFPGLELSLEQAEIAIPAREYFGMMLFLAIFYFAWLGTLLSIVLSKVLQNYLLLGFTIGAVVGLSVFIQFSVYPTMLIRKRQRELEKNLVFSMRTMLIEIKSGVSLFDAMSMVAKSNYGELSRQFSKVVDEINTGSMYDEALQKLATKNPSPYFRKAIWQIVNGMKAGGDVSDIIKETVKSVSRDQRIAITKYSSQLRFLTLMYMMIGVIMPALGLTFLIVISTLLGSMSNVEIGEPVYWVMLAAIVIMQFMYVGIIKSRRPTIIN